MARVKIELSKDDVKRALIKFFGFPKESSVLISAVERYHPQDDEAYHDVEIIVSYSEDLEPKG